jgi:site-specific recombinase XerD
MTGQWLPWRSRRARCDDTTRRLQHFLGHASIANTVRYTAMSPEPFKDIWRSPAAR